MIIQTVTIANTVRELRREICQTAAEATSHHYITSFASENERSHLSVS
jgi:hypothetical protein